MIRLSIPFRQALAKLTLPVLIMVSFGIVLLGKADAILAERARMAAADTLAPLFQLVAEPMGQVRSLVADAKDFVSVRSEVARLREDNESLLRWRAVALALEAENKALKANLRWIPDPAPSYFTARVVADAGGVYARAVLLAVGPDQGATRGQIALDANGVVGRITELGRSSARVLLITDLNSRIPVTLENSRARAILVGTNGPRPRLMYWPEGVTPAEGERVVTSAEAGAFPSGLPVGTLHYSANNVPEVEPAAQLSRLEVVRIFNYGLSGIEAPESRRDTASSGSAPSSSPYSGSAPARRGGRPDRG